MTADRFAAEMESHRSEEERQKIQRYFKTGGEDFMGVRMGKVFELAKAYIDMPPPEIEKLLEYQIHEIRAGGLSIMDKQARRKKTSSDRRQELYELYLRRHDRIDNWDLVDLAAPYVVGGYLFDKPRSVLFELAQSSNMWERRTAIVASYYFIRQNDLDDVYALSETLLFDAKDLIQKPVGSGLRWAGVKDSTRLRAFLDRYAATMPRTTLRYAIEHFPPEERSHYMGLRI